MRVPHLASRLLVAVVALLAFAAAASPALAGGGPAETVVLVNANSADSRKVAEHYAKARQIPPSQVVEVACTASLETSIGEFVRDVADPLRVALRTRGLEDRVRFVVMTQGMPIRARTPSGDVSTAAALALLHTPICGANQPGGRPFLRNPAYRGTVIRLPENVTTDRCLHVTALLSTTADEALALVDRSVASDGTAPKGALFVFQDASGNANTRNDRYDGARRPLEALGQATSRLPSGGDKAVNLKKVMGYMAGGAYSGLTPDGVKSNEYLPGAICDHLQSFGSVPQNFDPDAKRHTQFPVTHMIRAGITGVHGAVQEPYTVAFPDSDLFTAYVEGATLAETFDDRCPLAYWMNLVLGDPLCAPYAERPMVEVTTKPAAAWSGAVKFSAKAQGAKRIAVYIDGVEVAAADGAALETTIDTTPFADGARHVLVQAVAPGTWEPRGWKLVPATFANSGAHVAARPPRAASPFRVPLTRAAGADTPTVTLTSGGAAIPGTSRADGATLVFEPKEPLPAGPIEVAVTGLGEPVRWTATAAAAAVAAEGAKTLEAGAEGSLRAVARRPDGSPAAGWKGRIEVRQSDPPVLLVSRDVEAAADGAIEVPVRFTRAGALTLRVTLPDDRVEAVAQLTVTAGPPHHVTSPLQRVPHGQPCDLDVVAEDEFGNRAETFEGTLSLEVSDDPFATVPPPVRLSKEDRGQAVFRDVVFARGGPRALVFADGSGKRWSLPGEGVESFHAALRAWLVSSPIRGDDAAKAFAADPSAAADRDGTAANGRLHRRLRSRGDDVTLPMPGSKDGDAVAATAFLRAMSASKVRLLGAATGRIAVLLDGKPVFDGVPKAADPKGKREPLAEIDLAEGRHRLTVVALRAGKPPAFSLEIDDGAGKHVDPVTCAAAATDDPPATFTASGRVRRGGGGGAAAAKVTLRTADGSERTVTTGPDGTWYFEGLPVGEIEVRAEGQHPLSPASRKATLDGAHAVDLDFVAEDKAPPVVKVGVLAPRYGKKLVVEPSVEDEDGVRDVRLLLDDAEVARATAAPWRLEADVTAKARGKHTLVVVATDPSGNEGRSAAAEVTLIDDAKGPAVQLSGLAENADLKGKRNVEASVTDELPVESVRFRLDGKDVEAGKVSRQVPGSKGQVRWFVELDPKGLAAGAHALSVTATDLDGNETLVELKFRTK